MFNLTDHFHSGQITGCESAHCFYIVMKPTLMKNRMVQALRA